MYCGDICKEVERAKDCPGRVGGKSCSHRMAAGRLEASPSVYRMWKQASFVLINWVLIQISKLRYI